MLHAQVVELQVDTPVPKGRCRKACRFDPCPGHHDNTEVTLHGEEARDSTAERGTCLPGFAPRREQRKQPEGVSGPVRAGSGQQMNVTLKQNPGYGCCLHERSWRNW